MHIKEYLNRSPFCKWSMHTLTKIPHEHVPKSHVMTCDDTCNHTRSHVITRVPMSSHVILEHVHVEFL